MHPDTVDITDDFVSYISATFVLTGMHHANYLRLSQSHLNVDQISWSPIQVTKHPKNYKWKCMLDIFQTYFDWFFWCFEGENYWTHFCSWFGRSLFWTTSWGSRVKLAISQILTLYWGGTEDLTICWFAGTTSIRSRKTEQLMYPIHICTCTISLVVVGSGDYEQLKDLAPLPSPSKNFVKYVVCEPGCTTTPMNSKVANMVALSYLCNCH